MPAPFEPPLSTDEIESIFSKLTEIEIIKSGGEGTVLKAFDLDLNLNVAIKIYGPSHLKSRTDLEVEKLLKIDNPYMIKLYDYGEITIRGNSCYFTKTQFIDGDDLRTLLQENHNFSPEDVSNVLSCISSCVDSLWKQRVVHCDIKPDNIIKNGDNYILIDLGMAKHLDADTMTAAGMIMGTLGYLAPEQFKGRKNLTLKADYYALGITCYELLSGYHPYNRNQKAMLTQKAPDFPIGTPGSNELKNLILKMVEINPINRPINYNDIFRYLEEVK